MKVLAQDLIRAIEILALVPERAGVLSSEILRIVGDTKELRLYLASELKGQSTVPLKEPGEAFEVYIERSKFFAFVNVAKGGKGNTLLDLTYTEGANKERTFTMKSGRRKAVFSGNDAASGYADIARSKKATQVNLTNTQLSLLAVAAKYATADFSSAELIGVHLLGTEGAIAASLHGRINFFAETKLTVSSPIPEEFTGLLATAEMFVNKDGALLEFKDGLLYRPFISAQFAGKINGLAPAVAGHLKFPLVASVSAGKLVEMLTRLRSSAAEDLDYPVQVSTKESDSNLRFSVSGATWKFDETCRIAEAPGTVSLRAPLFRALPALEYLDKDEQVDLRFDNGTSMYLGAPKTKIHFIASLNIEEKKKKK